MAETEPVQGTFQPGLLSRLLARWGALWIGVFEMIGGVSWLLFDVMRWIWRGVSRRNTRLGRTAIVTQVVRVGVRSVAIVMLVSGAIGMILALQMKAPLDEFGQADKIANIVGVAIFRELGPLIAAIVLTGFAGAAIAAELGTMVVGEEIEALEAHALNPVRFLVVPRVLATTASLLCLAVIANLTAVGAGAGISILFLDVPAGLYWQNTINQVTSTDFVTGLIKAVVFGVILGSIACYNGLRVTGGAAGVGRATTSTVVQTIVWIIIADLLFTTMFFLFGWT